MGGTNSEGKLRRKPLELPWNAGMKKKKKEKFRGNLTNSLVIRLFGLVPLEFCYWCLKLHWNFSSLRLIFTWKFQVFIPLEPRVRVSGLPSWPLLLQCVEWNNRDSTGVM